MRLLKKGFVDHRTFGKTHQYYPLISKEEYRKTHTLKQLEEKIEKNKGNIQILSLRTTIIEAFKWMFPDERDAVEEGT